MSEATLAKLFQTSHYAIRVNTEGISDAEGLLSPDPGGNCMAWVVGHIVSSREGLLKLLGETPVLTPELATRYKRGSAPVTGPDDGLPLSELLVRFQASQERLMHGIESAPATLWETARDDFGSVRGAFFFLHFHEAYHAGQLGVLRRLAGKKGAIQ